MDSFDAFDLKIQKRERNANFSQEETNLLISLVDAKKQIIENKTSNAITWQNKERAWKEIEKKFNNSSQKVFRDHKHLKQKYEAIKRDARRKSAAVNDTAVLSPVEQKVKEIMLLQVKENGSCFDSDSVRSNSPSSDIIQPAMAFEQILKEDCSSNIDNDNTEHYEPPRKVFIVSPQEEQMKFDIKDKRPSDRLTEEKIEIATIQKKILAEELQQKSIQRKILEEEMEHKNSIYKIEREIKLKENSPNNKLIEEKIEIANLQKQILVEELEQKLIQRKILEKELEHKEYMHKQEKDHFLLKMKLLKKELGEDI